ncbi:MAG: hypothetical protein DRO11_02860 [Methanobacteriota archaeon]|nr:MAG: hypothetical protein DRO11_02860 [Euryarchaeota archaeon]
MAEKKTLVAVLGSGKGTWGHVGRLLSDEQWDRVILITNQFGRKNFSPEREVEWIVVNSFVGILSLIEEIERELNIDPDETIYLNMVSGSGKEHMAVLAALHRRGVDYQFVALTGNEISVLA